jgi:hypothetical protein
MLARFTPQAVCVLVVLSATQVAYSADRVAWLSAAEARQELEGTIRLTWPSNPLRDSLDNLARTRRLAIWLDRRIDPDQRVELKTDNVRLREALLTLAGQINGGVCLVGPVVYIGPRETTAKLFKLSAERRDEAGKLSADIRTRLAKSQALAIEDLAEPRALFEQLAAEAGLKVVGNERVPHDLWPAGDWPALTVVDRMSLVLAGFDLTYEFAPDGSAIRLAPYPASAAVERTHAVKGNVREFAEKLAGLFPAAKIVPGTGKVTVTASVADHETIAELVKSSGPKKPPPPGAKTVYTLKIENQAVGAAARALGKQMDLEIQFAQGLTPEQLGQRVTFQVKDATLDELFEALLKPAGLTHKLIGKTLEISPRN